MLSLLFEQSIIHWNQRTTFQKQLFYRRYSYIQNTVLSIFDLCCETKVTMELGFKVYAYNP